MKRYLLYPALLLTLLTARENPFAPAQTPGSEPLTKPIPAPDFDKALTPIIQSAVCKVAPMPKPTATTKPKTVWKHAPQAKSDTKKMEVHQAKKAKPHLKKKPVQQLKSVRHHRIHFHRIYQNDNLAIYAKPGYIKIVTSDTIQKDFRLRDPARIVFDFGDDFVIYPSTRKTLCTRDLKSLKIGTHDCFYRVTFVTRGNKRYKIRKKTYGYLIKLF